MVVLPFKERREAAAAAIEMSHWCKEMGLIHDRDYTWAFMSAKKELHFRFFNDGESTASAFALKWAGYEI